MNCGNLCGFLYQLTICHAILVGINENKCGYVWIFSMRKLLPGSKFLFLAKDVYGHSQITLIYYLPSLPNVTLPFMGKNTIELIIIPLRWYMYVSPIIRDMV